MEHHFFGDLEQPISILILLEIKCRKTIKEMAKFQVKLLPPRIHHKHALVYPT